MDGSGTLVSRTVRIGPRSSYKGLVTFMLWAWLSSRFVFGLVHNKNLSPEMRYQVLTGAVPFHEYMQHAVTHKVISGVRPVRLRTLPLEDFQTTFGEL